MPATVSGVASTELHLILGKGESLYNLFSRHELSKGDLVSMVRGDRGINRTLRSLRPGQQITIRAGSDGAVQELILVRPGPTDLLITRAPGDRFHMRKVDDDPVTADAALLASLTPDVSASRASHKGDDGGQPLADVVGDRAEQAEKALPQAATKLAASRPTARSADAPRNTMHRVTIRSGDSLYGIFRRLGVPPQDLARLLDADKRARRLRNLHPGQELAIDLAPDKSLERLAIALDEERTFIATRRSGGDDYVVDVKHQPLEARATSAAAVIENSLFVAGQRAGLSDRVIMELTEIFGWDVDFALDVRPGDRFTVLYEELYKDGEKVRDGPILAAEFFNRGRSVRALRYEDETGRSRYFSPEGLSMRKAFLRTPVNFSRISSRFSRGRLHPVLQRMRAHKGVDYAAPRGTPVKATGNGRVIFAGRKGGFGKTVVIQHGSTYTTLYAHMSRIHRRARTGNRVQQGDVIGYVGSTGLATGPHLHYEFRVRGVHADPLRVDLPKALPIEAEYKQDFLRKSQPLVKQLDVLANTSLAASN